MALGVGTVGVDRILNEGDGNGNSSNTSSKDLYCVSLRNCANLFIHASSIDFSISSVIPGAVVVVTGGVVDVTSMGDGVTLDVDAAVIAIVGADFIVVIVGLVKADGVVVVVVVDVDVDICASWVQSVLSTLWILSVVTHAIVEVESLCLLLLLLLLILLLIVAM